jgi:hypothetical protein
MGATLDSEVVEKTVKSEYLQRITRRGRPETGELADFPLNWQFRRKKSGADDGVCLCEWQRQFMVGAGVCDDWSNR